MNPGNKTVELVVLVRKGEGYFETELKLENRIISCSKGTIVLI